MYGTKSRENQIQACKSSRQVEGTHGMHLIFLATMCDIALEVLTAAATAAKSLQSCLTLCDPIDGSPPGSPIPGILQARTLEWVAISLVIAP